VVELSQMSIAALAPGVRARGLAQELGDALNRTEPRILAEWGLLAGKHFTRALGRRATNLSRLAGVVVNGVTKEGKAAVDAFRSNQGGAHSKKRLVAAKGTLTVLSGQIAAFGKTVASAVAANPKQAAPQLAVLVISSVLVSGGPDGDGGAADLDLIFGIDAHRSIFTHSILMGAALEAGICSLVDLVRIVHEKLPVEHDPLWDSVYQQTEEFARAAQVGASIGLAYHLFVDGLAQPAPYKDLPISMPIEGHQAVFVANAATEALDAKRKPGASKFTGDRALEELRHKHYRSQRLAIREDITKNLTQDELALIRRYGAWMAALSNGAIQPLTASQEQFFEVANQRREPKTPHERAWRTYFHLTKKTKTASH